MISKIFPSLAIYHFQVTTQSVTLGLRRLGADKMIQPEDHWMIIGASFGQKQLFVKNLEGQPVEFMVVSHEIGKSISEFPRKWRTSNFPLEDRSSNFLENFGERQLLALLPREFFPDR